MGPPYVPWVQGKSGWGVKLTTQLHLLSRLRVSGGITLLPLYAFIASTGKKFTFTFARKKNKGKSMFVSIIERTVQETEFKLVYFPFKTRAIINYTSCALKHTWQTRKSFNCKHMISVDGTSLSGFPFSCYECGESTARVRLTLEI